MSTENMVMNTGMVADQVNGPVDGRPDGKERKNRDEKKAGWRSHLALPGWMQSSSLPTLESGSIEYLKWMAALFMLLDHFNAVIFAGGLAWMNGMGRMAFPLFAFIFALNLARYDGLWDKWVANSWKLLLAGVAAMPAFIFMRETALQYDSWYPLNIMFTFFFAGTLLAAWQRLRHLRQARRQGMPHGSRKYRLALSTLAMLSALVVMFSTEYEDAGLLMILASFAFMRGRTSLLFVSLAIAYLIFWQGMAWWVLGAPMLVALVMLAQSRWGDLPVPRVRHFFYIFYPAHLWVLMLLKLAL